MRLTIVLALLLSVPAHGREGERTVRVPEGADLQQAIDAARPGDTLLLDPGATYRGNFILTEKPGGEHVIIRTGGSGEGLPREGERVSPRHAPRMAKLQSPNKQPVLRTAPRSHHWRLELIEFLPTEAGFGDIITLGNGGPKQNDLSLVPRELVIDRCYVHGDPEKGQKRGIALNSASTTIIGSHISDIKAVGQDAQAIAGWNGPGPYRIENNYLEGAAENFILGGSDPAIDGLVAQDVVFRGNHLAKPVEWRGQRWQVKNLFQLKNAKRVLVEGNLMEHTWKDAQVGYAILLTPRNQDGRAPWVTIEDVTIRNNVIRHAGGGMQITGEDSNHRSGSTSGVKIIGNLFYGLDSKRWGGTGAFVLIGGGPRDITIEHNTISQTGNIVMAYGGTKAEPRTVASFVFRDNVIRHNTYGVHGADRAPGRDSLEAFFPGAVFTGNVIAGGDAKRYPAGNSFIRADEFDALFAAPEAGDFSPRPGGRLSGEGRQPPAGVDFAGLSKAVRDFPDRGQPRVSRQ